MGSILAITDRQYMETVQWQENYKYMLRGNGNVNYTDCYKATIII